MKLCDVRRASQDQELQRRIDRVVDGNSSKAGRHVKWQDTEIIMTDGAIGTDVFANAFGRREWWTEVEEKITARLKLKRKGRSYAQDAAPEERDKLSKLVGLRYYFSQLGPTEPVNMNVVLPLLSAIENNG